MTKSAHDQMKRIDQDADLTARYQSEQENGQDQGLDDEATNAYALRATLSWDAQGRPEEG